MIEVAGLARRYGDGFAVTDVSFRVEPGELLALVGGSGSGKTTTLKMINRLVEPDAGRVVVEGRDAASVEPHALRRSIGYVFQGIGLFPHMTVAENVAVPLGLLGWPRDRIDARVAELLSLVELGPEHAARLPSALSGGEQQRVAFCRAVLNDPAIILADEPTGNLDEENAAVILHELSARAGAGAAVVLVTHSHDLARTADRVLHLTDGRLADSLP